MSSFTKKELKFIITLGVGSFGSRNNSEITLEGFRAVVDIDKAGGMMAATLQAKIYGVSLEHMNSITTLLYTPKDQQYFPNTIVAYAVDGDSSTVVFAGNILQAWGEFRGMPEVYLHVQAMTAFFDKMKAVPPRSFKGQVDVATAMKQIAEAMNLNFENNGVTSQLADQYLANTAFEQAQVLAHDARCDIYFDNTTLAITPKGMPRKSSSVPVISKDTGLWGYPTFTANGVIFRMLYDPSVKWGATVQLKSDITPACGAFTVFSMSLRLESERPGGEWFATILGVPVVS